MERISMGKEVQAQLFRFPLTHTSSPVGSIQTCSVPALLKIVFNRETIQLFFLGEVLTIEKETAKVFLNGVEQFGFRKHHSAFSQEINLRLKKTRVVELKKKSGAFVVTKGADGRLFFSFWDSPQKYMIMGKKADWIASYWLHDGKKEWFERDLHSPKEVF